MSKSGKKKGKAGGKRANSRFADHNISAIHQHQRLGNTLIPPLAQIPKMTKSSWADDHMPEMLWAVLLTGTLDRRHYLNCFRRVAILCREWFKREEATQEGNDTSDPNSDSEINFTAIADLTKLAEVSDENFHSFISIPLSHPLGYAALRPLLLIDSIPGIDRWRREIGAQPTRDDWSTLAHSIARVFDHQSEASTDIRWFKVILPTISGRMFFPPSAAEFLEEMRLFPDKGDMRRVRPLIRSAEMMIRRSPPTTWIAEFWAQALRNTGCLDPSEGQGYEFSETEIDPDSLFSTRDQVIACFRKSLLPERADARLDGSFGLILYALSVLEEICMHRLHTRVLGVVALRALVEANITFRYLAHKDKVALWQSYRVYGAGQAKLAFLKIQEATGDLPNFLDETALHEIANEDTWQEFLNIDVGHWANSNLRKLSLECDAKETYDKYYDWSSGFIHGNWGAIRDTNFVTCHNPLHRLHRIPRMAHRALNSVEPDAIALVNKMIGLLGMLYPNVDPITLVATRMGPPDLRSAKKSHDSPQRR